jgi:gluconate 2-dehydrogenase subunit 3-like protein
MEDRPKEPAEVETPPPGPRAFADILADFVDVLIPGDDNWPSASKVGAQAVLATRLADLGREDDLDRIAGFISAAGGFADKSDAERTAIVADLERRHARLFKLVREAVALAYYESPAAAERIRSLGFSYKLRPHIEGYAMSPVDANRDRPHHKRGGHVRTEDVRRLDLSGLDWLSQDQRGRADGE